jgi:hypothetical protein
VLKRCVGFALGVMMAPTTVWAAAWTLPQGSGQVLATVTASTSTSAFTNSGNLTSVPRYDKVDGDALLEYGLTDQLTLMLQSGLQHVDIASPVDAARTGLDYTDFGARYRFFEADGWVLSGQALLQLPGTTNQRNSAAIGYTDVEADFRMLLGKGFSIGALPAFIDLEVAQRQRGDGAPDEFHADGTFGVQVLPRWLILAQSFNVVSEGAGNPVFGKYDYFKFQLSAVYSVTSDWAVQGGAFTTYAGSNALQENGIVLGVWRKF